MNAAKKKKREKEKKEKTKAAVKKREKKTMTAVKKKEHTQGNGMDNTRTSSPEESSLYGKEGLGGGVLRRKKTVSLRRKATQGEEHPEEEDHPKRRERGRMSSPGSSSTEGVRRQRPQKKTSWIPHLIPNPPILFINPSYLIPTSLSSH